MRLENTSAGAAKFWEAKVSGTDCEVSYGKIGSNGRTTIKSFDTPAEAKAYVEKKVREKLRGGYSVKDGFDQLSRSNLALDLVLGSRQPNTPAPAAPAGGGVLNTRLAATTSGATATSTSTDASPGAATLHTADSFKNLSRGDKSRICLNATTLGYTHDDLGEDEPFAKKLLGDAGMTAIFDYTIERAEEDADNSEDDPEIGAPSLSTVIAIKSGNEIIAYQIETHINWQPADIDIIGEFYVDTDGKIFEESVR